ncbi:acyl-CoA dehydrogenase family protein [Subtercola endophyticus]|uniref:acyl-CoA dehydrogenase n=1 Tax=Subtercola endophyticus TaxID=2895559 RepID=UPI001E3A588E|nr:acyl-CoA dehydrogenase [Subtercola endophyticus]UFS60441.1 acyl-CoA dehydrogenase [Subtercola endophyticus]
MQLSDSLVTFGPRSAAAAPKTNGLETNGLERNGLERNGPEPTGPEPTGLEPQVQDALQRLLDVPAPTVADALALARVIGATGIRPGIGRTKRLWELLATVGAHDLGSARALEPHLDALAILAESGSGYEPTSGLDDAVAGATWGLDDAVAGATWGVFASEGGGGAPVTASRTADGAFSLSGLKPWCSLADRLDRALVTATLDAGALDAATIAAAALDSAAPARQLFAVDLRHPGVTVLPGEWHPRGLSEIPSGPVRFEAVPAQPVGAPGWYLTRPGFWWGAVGVAACWYGGVVGVARTLFDAAHARPAPDPLLLMHLGAVDAQLNDCRRALAEAAALVDAGAATGAHGGLLANRVRATVARASESVLLHVAHALGPAPLAQNAVHAKRVADLELYVRQHHAEKDDAALGQQLLAPGEGGARPW